MSSSRVRETFAPQAWWPPTLVAWFKRASSETLSKAEWMCLVRLATDPRMEEVYRRFLLEEKRGVSEWESRAVELFMQDALYAHRIWDGISALTARKVRSVIKRIGTKSRELIRAIEELPLETTWQMLSWGHVTLKLEPVAQYPDHLVRALRALDVSARTGRHFVLTLHAGNLPKKMGAPNAEELFCIGHLAESARMNFRKPLYKEVGIIVSVLFNLRNSRTIPPSRVKDIATYKGKRRGGNSDIPV